MTHETESLGAVCCAVRALRKEILGFRFDYPLEVVSEAGPKSSLHYYIYSDKLSWDAMRLDPRGVPRAWYRATGAVYWPGYIAWYGLVHLERYLRERQQEDLEVFLKQIEWLEENVVVRADGAAVWTMDFDYQEGPTLLKAPWVSAHAQGLAISAVVRGWRLTRRPELLALLERSARIFELAVSDGGIRVGRDGYSFYTEVPGGPAPGILDGFMTSLLGLYDLYIETGGPKIEELFRQGVEGLRCMLPQWDYGKKWSWYGHRRYLAPPAYHGLNRTLIAVLARLTNEPSFAEYAKCWDPTRLSTVQRAEIYASFVVTKNLCRLKHRTWRNGQCRSAKPTVKAQAMGRIAAQPE